MFLAIFFNAFNSFLLLMMISCLEVLDTSVCVCVCVRTHASVESVRVYYHGTGQRVTQDHSLKRYHVYHMRRRMPREEWGGMISYLASPYSQDVGSFNISHVGVFESIAPEYSSTSKVTSLGVCLWACVCLWARVYEQCWEWMPMGKKWYLAQY